jgi:ABC-type glycerol-3-phosphate transport system permease component
MSRTLKHDWPIHLILIILAFFTFYPFVFMVLTSFKSTLQFTHDFWGLPNPIMLANYTDAWKRVNMYLVNSLIVSGASVIGVLTFGSITAFAFARFKFPGREALFLMLLALLMVPSVLTLVPTFLLIKSFGLRNTWWALILPYVSGGQIFAIFILRSFFAMLPEELFESARMDGAKTLQTFTHIALPLSMPTLVTVAIVNLLATWNDYIWPLVTISDGKRWTISVGVVSFGSQYMGLESWGPMFAGYVIASLPLLILFVFTMRYFIAGLTSGAIKA